MRVALQTLYWILLSAGLLWIVACPTARRVFEDRVEYLSSPAGEAHLERLVAEKIYERYGEEALVQYDDGEAAYPSAVSDIVISELYGPPLLTFLAIVGAGLALLGYGSKFLFRESDE